MLPHTPAYLCRGLDHTLALSQEDCRSLSTVKNKTLGGFIFEDGDMHDRTLFLALLFGFLDVPILSHTTSLWCHPMPSVLAMEGKTAQGDWYGLEKSSAFHLSLF